MDEERDVVRFHCRAAVMSGVPVRRGRGFGMALWVRLDLWDSAIRVGPVPGLWSPPSVLIRADRRDVDRIWMAPVRREPADARSLRWFRPAVIGRVVPTVGGPLPTLFALEQQHVAAFLDAAGALHWPIDWSDEAQPTPIARPDRYVDTT